MSDYTVQVHRFRQGAAIHAGDGKTVYMTARDARRIAKALNAIARSIDNESFADSKGLTVISEAWNYGNFPAK